LALLTWRKSKSVGVKDLDDQHRGMMRILNELHAAAMKGRVGEVAGPLLGQVSCASREHFSSEEELMEQTRYPGLAEHRAIHQALLAKAAEFLVRHDEGDMTAYVELLYFVRDWFLDHLEREDKKYTVWMNEHGVQ
jgi:hemerythrin-like metal-binding protein